jgi:hypothetical protein
MPEDHSPIHSKDEDSNFFQNGNTHVFNILKTINKSKYPKFKKVTFHFLQKC